MGRFRMRGSAAAALVAGLALSVPAAIAARAASVPVNIAILDVFAALWFLSMASLASALQTRLAVFFALPGRRRNHDGLVDSIAIALQALTLTVLVMTVGLLV